MMTLDELITQTSEQHNVFYEDATEAFAEYHGTWAPKKVLEAIGVLGDAGMHGKQVGRILTLISEEITKPDGGTLFSAMAARCVLYEAGLLPEMPKELRGAL